MSPDAAEKIRDSLKDTPALADLPVEELKWLSGILREVTFEEGEILAREGDPANTFFILLEGEMQFRRESDNVIFSARPGEIGGKLPYSRLTQWTGTVRAMMPCKILVGTTDTFPEMVRVAPNLVQRLVGMMSDRIRYATREDQQRDKLAALGKLSAGLAHELNNPATAAKRAALGLSEAQQALREAISRLDGRELTLEQRRSILHFEKLALERARTHTTVDSLTQSDQEEQIADWMDEQHLNKEGFVVVVLAESGLDVEWLSKLHAEIGTGILPDALLRITAQMLAERLTREIASSTGRIGDLVKAIKEYSYMDQAPNQEVDIHDGIESTLVMLHYKLKQGITVERDFDRSIPRVSVFGSELNQVWTNLIDNAADAMKNSGKLTIRTCRDGEEIVVEIRDNGPGIPDEIQAKIFEPFFTTKKMGEGTGLGLDTVWKIVRKHHGTIRVESDPGDTRFEVRLPVSLKNV